VWRWGTSPTTAARRRTHVRGQRSRNYAKPGNDCDEFPFASTNEVAANNDGTDFSVQIMPKDDNRIAGLDIGGWYDAMRFSTATPTGWT